MAPMLDFFKEIAEGRSILGGNVCCESISIQVRYVNLTFRSNSENLLTVIKELAIARILCGRLYA